MTRFVGSGLVATWVHPAGTITLSTDFTSMNYDNSGKLVDATAGADTFDVYLATTKNVKVGYQALMPSAGTALEDALAANTFGTLTVQPEGTATGKRKYTIPAFAQGAKITWPYADTCSVTCDFQGSGTPTIGVN